MAKDIKYGVVLWLAYGLWPSILFSVTVILEYTCLNPEDEWSIEYVLSSTMETIKSTIQAIGRKALRRDLPTGALVEDPLEMKIGYLCVGLSTILLFVLSLLGHDRLCWNRDFGFSAEMVS